MPDLDTVKEVRALEHIFICRENCCVLHCTNEQRWEFITPLHRELPNAGLLMEANEGTVSEASEVSKATCCKCLGPLLMP